MPKIVADKQTWEFPEGHEIAPGRTILKLLGGGNRYEVYLVWDDRLFSVMVAKVLRPDLVEEEYALRGMRREWRRSRRSPIRSSCARLPPTSRARTRMWSLSTSRGPRCAG